MELISSTSRNVNEVVGIRLVTRPITNVDQRSTFLIGNDILLKIFELTRLYIMLNWLTKIDYQSIGLHLPFRKYCNGRK